MLIQKEKQTKDLTVQKRREGGMKGERPIIFSTDMVRAILEGRKTQTRRPIKPQPENNSPVYWDEDCQCWKQDYIDDYAYAGGPPIYVADSFDCPFKKGMRLWVRESFLPKGIGIAEKMFGCLYKANGDKTPYGKPWRSPIYMPRWASRITLKITDIRVERVQGVQVRDIQAEGITASLMQDQTDMADQLRDKFKELWNSINIKKGFGWDENPWVWVLEFKTV